MTPPYNGYLYNLHIFTAYLNMLFCGLQCMLLISMPAQNIMHYTMCMLVCMHFLNNTYIAICFLYLHKSI